MILKSFGCSFIFGTDLADDGQNWLYAKGSQLTWPALIAQDLGYEYQTYARPGSGNLQILERLLEQTTSDEPSKFVVGWSYIDRFDFIKKDVEKWPGTPWSTILPSECNQVNQFYFKHLHSQLHDKLSSLIYAKTAIDVLRQKNIPFVMTYMDPLMFETQWHCNPTILELQNYIRPYMTLFDNKNFLEFSQACGYPISERFHPLDEAHAAAAELIKSYNLL
jgi:hypothetical protein